MRQVILAIAWMSAVSCGDSDGRSPSSPTPTSPASPAQTWTLTGTVSETFPTGSTRIAGATITAVAGLDADGPSITSDANGAFQLAGLAPGTYTIRGRARYYEESSQPLTLTGNQTLAVQLDPVFQMVTTSRRDVVTGHPSCPGWWDFPACEIPRTTAGEPCAIGYVFDVHHDGTLAVGLEWADRRYGLGADLCGSDGGQPSGSARTPRVDGSGRVVGYDVSAHTQYVVLVRSLSDGGGSPPGGTAAFTVTVTRPN
jgi:hypothetical protein